MLLLPLRRLIHMCPDMGGENSTLTIKYDIKYHVVYVQAWELLYVGGLGCHIQQTRR